MDQGIRSVQNGQRSLMVTHEPLLHVMFSAREEDAQPTELLEIEHRQAMVLCYIPNGFGKYLLGQDFGHTVKEVRDNPIKHLDQEGKFLQDSAVEVVGKTRSLWGKYDGSTPLPTFWEFLGGLRSPMRARFIIEPRP